MSKEIKLEVRTKLNNIVRILIYILFYILYFNVKVIYYLSDKLIKTKVGKGTFKNMKISNKLKIIVKKSKEE